MMVSFINSCFRNVLNSKVLGNSVIFQLRRCHVETGSALDEILVEQCGPVRTIGINRPGKRNCLDTRTARNLSEIITAFEEDDNSLAGVLYGTGGNFCSGFDLNELSKGEIRPEDLLRSEGSMGPTRRPLKKPLICAVSGYAVAGGFELALMCDLRVVEETAVMGVLCRRFGVPLIDGGTVRLTAMVGVSRALDYVLTGREISAKEAFEVGIANRIVATGAALGQAVNLANSLTKFPVECMLADRSSVLNAAYDSSSLQQALEFELKSANPCILHKAVQGAKKFTEGIGKHGKFYSLQDKKCPQWEKDEIEREKK